MSIDRLSYADAQLASLHRVLAHVRSETTNSLDAIMDTVSRTVCYLMPDVSQSALPMQVLTEREEVRNYYGEERNFLAIVDAADLMEVATDWYVFHEGIATTTEISSGNDFSHNYVVLFPVADDGIIGEILWPRQSLADLYANRPVDDGSKPGDWTHEQSVARRQRHHDTHQSYLRALAAGDRDTASALWAPDARVAVRQCTAAPDHIVEGTGAAAVNQRIGALLDAVSDPEIHVLSRLVGDWYVFADWVVRGRATGSIPHLSGSPVELRMASIYPMTIDSHIGAELGYGLDCTAVHR